MMVTDRNGKAIQAGQMVRVYQDDATRLAVVVKPLPQCPTVNAPGYWVDVNIDNEGPQGMPSYLLEVVDVVASEHM